MKLAIVGTRNPGVSYAHLKNSLFANVNNPDATLAFSCGDKAPNRVNEGMTKIT